MGCKFIFQWSQSWVLAFDSIKRKVLVVPFIFAKVFMFILFQLTKLLNLNWPKEASERVLHIFSIVKICFSCCFFLTCPELQVVIEKNGNQFSWLPVQSSKNFVLFSFWLNYVYFSKCFPIKYVFILFKDVLEIGDLVAIKYKEFPE